jgi:hypothetical protein
MTYQSILQLLESGMFPLIFMTTNSLETLERMQALDRFGRIDQKIEFRNSTPEQIKGFFMMFYAKFRKSGWEQSGLEQLHGDFSSALSDARAQVELLKPGEGSAAAADEELLHAAAACAEKKQKRQGLYERRMRHLEEINATVCEIALSEQSAQGADRKHWLNVLGSMAGNHFQNKKYAYSMAQVEKFFQSMMLGNRRT